MSGLETPFENPFDKVIIVGAGSAGLILAILLAQHGIKSVVLEAGPHVDTRLRATQYGVPATRVFRRAGILDDIRAGSIKSFGSITWRRTSDHHKLVEVDMSCIATHPDRMTIMPLGDMVQIMLRHCHEKYGDLIDVKFQHRAVGIRQDEDKAWVEVEVGEKKNTATIDGDFVVGCDGSQSAIRKALFGRNWPGETFAWKAIVQNIWYDGFEKFGWQGGNYMVDPDAWGLIARRGQGGLWRITYGDIDGFTDEEYVERRATRLEKMLPGNPKPEKYRLGDTHIYKMHNRCADSFRVGRVLLAGDAAHICNPWGGYGCMSAILDSAGLAECFIGYHEGLATESILDKYSEIRREKYLKYVDERSRKNMNRLQAAESSNIAETDKLLSIFKGFEGDPEATKEFLLKQSSIEHDFTQYYATPL